MARVPAQGLTEARVFRDVYTLSTWQWLPRAQDEVFAFFADAFNLERITPGFLRFRVLTPPPIAMAAGTLIDYRLRLHGVPVSWRTEITVWEPSHRFCDVQLRGPYREWVHMHTFEPKDGGTLVHDVVRYRLIGPDPATRVIHRVLVGPDTTRIFEHRHTAMEDALDARGQSRRGPVSIVRSRL
jgi:ligand-binding SRPBCC domain-containing protein